MAQYTENYHLSKPEPTDTQSSFISEYCNNMDKIDQNLGGGGGSSVSWSQLQVTGDKIATITVSGIPQDVFAPNSQTFTMAVSRANINSGETYSTIFGKIKKWFNDLKTVAFSGSYNDLSDQPNIPTATSDLNNDSDFVSDASYVHTDNNFTNADVTKLSGIQSGAEVNVQSDWNEADNTADAYIANKPSLATVATSGSYNDLSNKPTIPDELADLADDSTHRVVTDAQISTWNGKSDFSGSYNDLTDKPTIPTVNDGTLTIQQNGTTVGTFTANQSGNTTVNLSGGGGSAHTIVNESGTSLADEPNLQFTDGLKATDDSVNSKTVVGVNTTFTEAVTRTNIASGDTFATILGKIKKFFTDLKSVAFSGSYNDLSDKPTIPDISTKVSKSGDTMTGCLRLQATGAQGNFDEGVRINQGAGGWSTLVLGGSTDSTVGTSDGQFWLGVNRTIPSFLRKLFISHNGSSAGQTYFHANSSSDQSPKLHIPSGSIASADYDAVNGDAVYNYIASGNKDIDNHDADTCIKNGMYYYTSNGPATSLGASTTDGALYVQKYNSDWVAQIAQDYRNGRLFVRGKNSGTWQSWLRIALYSEIPNVSGKVNRSGDTMTGALTIEGTDNFAEGLRCNTASDGYFSLLLGGTGTSGTRDGAFWLGGNNTQQARKLFISHNSSTQSGTYFYANSASDASPSLRIGGNLNVVNSTSIYSPSTDTVLNLSTAVRSGECCIKFSGITTGGSSVTLAEMYVDQYDFGRKGIGTVRRPLAYRSEISSKRYKENISPILEEDAKKILDVEIVNFDYKEEYEVVAEKDRCGNVGVIAEEVVNLIPNAVTYADIEGEQLPDSVNYTKFIPYLIKMVQMQQKEIEELKAMIKEVSK